MYFNKDQVFFIRFVFLTDLGIFWYCSGDFWSCICESPDHQGRQGARDADSLIVQ